MALAVWWAGRLARWISMRLSEVDLRAGSHLGARGGIADVGAVLLLLVYDADKMPQVTVVLDTLVSNPLAWLDRLGPGAEGHEVALDDVLGIGRVDPGREWGGQVVSFKGLIPVGA